MSEHEKNGIDEFQDPLSLVTTGRRLLAKILQKRLNRTPGTTVSRVEHPLVRVRLAGVGRARVEWLVPDAPPRTQRC